MPQALRMMYASAYAIRERTRRARWLAPALAFVVAAFLAFSLPPYFTGGTRVPATFGLHYPLLVGHVMFASIAMVAALAQIWPGLHNRHPVLHRRVGRVYVCTAIPAALCAMVIGAATPFGPILAVSNCFGIAVVVVHDKRLPRGPAAALHRAPAPHDSQRDAGVLHHHQPDLDTRCCLSPFIRCRTASFGDEKHFLWVVAGVGAWLGWTIPWALCSGGYPKPVMPSSSIPRLSDTQRV